MDDVMEIKVWRGGVQRVRIPIGSTVADLLDEMDWNAEGYTVQVNAEAASPSTVLQPGALVMLIGNVEGA